MLRVNQIRLELDEDKEVLKHKVAVKLHMPESEITKMRIFRESIDARKNDLHFSYTIDVKVKEESRYLHKKDVSQAPHHDYVKPISGVLEAKERVVVVGFGPAGMFASLLLAQMGYRPYIIERGGDVDERIMKVEEFWNEGILDISSNVQFGEGGAGTFSDGKLTTRSKDLRSRKVLEEFVKFGAPEEILYEAHPHIGTDLLRGIVKKIRQEIMKLGGEIHFHSQLKNMKIANGHMQSIQVNDRWMNCEAMILAIGHSARDTFTMLSELPVAMEPKAFAVGVRIEHPQEMIDKVQYKELYQHPRLRAAEYRLSHTSSAGRGVYTFCMCPGGSVVASASEAGGVVVNGMSEHARDKTNGNSALLVQVGPDDYGHGILDGIAFQRRLEQRAFQLGQGNYHAPAQRVQDFLAHKASTKQGGVIPTYRPSLTYCDLHELFPSFINEALEEGILNFDRKLKGFAMEDAIMTGVETRSSSPIRILRDRESFLNLEVDNVYPSGEGAGYAGGIVSAGIDGLRCAEKIIERFAPTSKF